MTFEELFQKLATIEFATWSRYSKICPACRGAEEENYGYVVRGPDRGHEQGCWLRAALDLRKPE